MVSHRLVGSITRSVGPAATLGALIFSASSDGSSASSSVQFHTSSPASASQPRPIGGASVRIESNLPAAASTVTASNVGCTRTRCCVIDEPNGVGVEGLLLDGLQAGRHVIDAVGGQQPAGVLVEHGDLVGDAAR